MNKDNSKRCLDFTTTYNMKSKRIKHDGEKKEGNIRNIIKLLNNYCNHDDALEDMSDYMVSSYKNFLIECIYKEIKNINEEKNERKDKRDDIIKLIGICLKIIKNHHEVFKYANIYYVCINTLFLLLNNITYNNNNDDDVINYMIYSCFDMFFNLISSNNWARKNCHIHIFSKLNFIHFFIISKLFKRLYIQIDDTIYMLPFKYYINMIIKNIDIYQLDNNILGENKKEKYEEKNDDFFNIEENDIFITSLKNRNNHLQKVSDSIYDSNIFHSTYGLSYDDMNDYYKTYKNIKRTNIYIIKEKEKNVDNSNENNIDYVKNINNIYYIMNNIHNNYGMVLKNYDISYSYQIYYDILFKIFSTIINLIINNDLTIYIIKECVSIILNMCDISKKQHKIIFDILSVYKFYIKNKQKMLERYIIFIFYLINAILDEEKKRYFSKLIKPLNMYFYLLQSECSEIRMCVKEYLLLHSINNNNGNKGKEIILSHNNLSSSCSDNNYNYMLDVLYEDSLNELHICNITNILNETNNCIIQFVKSIHLIFLHLKYILDICKSSNVHNEQFYFQYDLFFKDLGTDPVFKNYLQNDINMKKEKIFYKCNSIICSDKYIIIKNNIIEIENLIKTIDVYMNLLNSHNIKYLSLCIIYFIFFFIKILKYINKIYDADIQRNFSKNFFFIIKHLFIQSIYVFEMLIERKAWEEINNILMYIIKSQHDNKKNEHKKLHIFNKYNIINKKYIINYIKNNSASGELNEQPLNILIKKFYLTIINFLIPVKYQNKIQSNVLSGHIINNNDDDNKNNDDDNKNNDDDDNKNNDDNNKNNDDDNKNNNNIEMIIINKGVKTKWPFFNISNFYFFIKLLLNIFYFFYKNNMCENFMGIFFFDSIFKRVKEKIIQEEPDIFILLKKQKIHFGDVENDDTNIELKYKKYISYELSSYISFCLYFLKSILLFDDKLYNILNYSKYKKDIINLCKLQLCMYEFFLPAKSTNNGFSLSILVLYYLYIKIYHNKNKDKKIVHLILRLIFYATYKSLNTMQSDNIIIYKNGTNEDHTSKQNKMNNNDDDNNDNNYYYYNNNCNNFDFTHLKTRSYPKHNNDKQFIINRNFEKPFEEYYLNNSLHAFLSGLNVLTNITKLIILKYDIVYKNNIIIKGSNILNKQKKKKKKRSSIITVYYRYLYKLYNVLMKKTKDDFFYSTRKYVLQYIKHFIILNTVLIMNYKYRNNINFKKVLSFCLYNLYTDYDVSVFSLIYSIAFSLRNYINLCSSKIKKSNYYLERVDYLLFKVVEEYKSYDIPETNLWEEYISKYVSFETLKHTNVDCPGE
ncbi:conserved Plasmodium membrane protein, unknown function [Plasmodium sp. DRC-Itaito]|nr:conserved Plasmodium membrane protein, unknown function [Plasmodium sp. DRC-Itaito]